jgi:hypothetical protein
MTDEARQRVERETACEEWRPLPMKGICKCGLRWHEHSDAAQFVFRARNWLGPALAQAREDAANILPPKEVAALKAENAALRQRAEQAEAESAALVARLAHALTPKADV